MGREDGPPGGRAVASSSNTRAQASTGCDSAAQTELNGMAIGSSRAITPAWEIFSGYFEQR